jgi:hypothetical protein
VWVSTPAILLSRANIRICSHFFMPVPYKGSLDFPLSPSKCWDGSYIPNSYCALLVQPARNSFNQINFLAVKATKIYLSKLRNSPLIQEHTIPRPLSLTNTHNRPKVVTFTQDKRSKPGNLLRTRPSISNRPHV